MPRHTPRCPNPQLSAYPLLLGDTPLVQHFLRTNTPRTPQETQVLPVVLRAEFSPALPSRDTVQSKWERKGVFRVASYYRMNSCSLERAAVKCSPDMTGI